MKNINSNIVGYCIDPASNGTYMYDSNTDGLARCHTCGFLVELGSTNPSYVFKKTFKPIYMDIIVSSTKAALTCTNDGQYIASANFKQFCESEGYKGLDFVPLTGDLAHFHFKINNIVNFDTIARPPTFVKLCPECNNYEEIFGAHPVNVQASEQLPAGLYRTDLPFGYGDSKSPLLIVGPAVKETLVSRKFKGMYLEKVYGS